MKLKDLRIGDTLFLVKDYKVIPVEISMLDAREDTIGSIGMHFPFHHYTENLIHYYQDRSEAIETVRNELTRMLNQIYSTNGN